jgi:hypothetical protein
MWRWLHPVTEGYAEELLILGCYASVIVSIQTTGGACRISQEGPQDRSTQSGLETMATLIGRREIARPRTNDEKQYVPARPAGLASPVDCRGIWGQCGLRNGA